MSNQVQEMVRFTSILLPLAQSRKRRLEEAAEARGETLESFILEAADSEARRIGQRLSEQGHSVDHQIYSSALRQPTFLSGAWKAGDEHQIAAERVAIELGWRGSPSEDWLSDVDRLIESLDTLDGSSAAPASRASTDNDSRRRPRRSVRSVQVLNPVRGTVVNMSEAGLGVETRGPLSVPETVHLSIGRSMTCAKIRVEVRWCVLLRTESFQNGDVVPIYRSGLAFLGH